jgi:hypothetical protein
MRRSARLPWRPRAGWARRHATTLVWCIVLAVVAVFSLSFLFPRTTGSVLAAAAVWAALTLAAVLVRRPRAIHLTLLAGLGAVLKLAAPKLWPGAGALSGRPGRLPVDPAGVGGASDDRRLGAPGIIGPGVRWLVLAVIPVAAAGLVLWAAAVGCPRGPVGDPADSRGVPVDRGPGGPAVPLPQRRAGGGLLPGRDHAGAAGHGRHHAGAGLQAASFGLLHTEGFPSGRRACS